MSEIQSVARSFSIIEYLSSSAKALQLKEIAAACSLPPPTAHRLLHNLCELGYVINEGNGQYHLSMKLYEISSRTVMRSSLISIAKPYLDELSEQLRESVHLVVRNGCDIVYVYKVTHTTGSIQLASKIGTRLPMYRTAVGKALLATLEDSEIAYIFNNSEIIAATPNTITSLELLMRDIQQVRVQGYAVDNEENEPDVKCVGISLGKSVDDVRYAFSVSSIKTRMSVKRIEEIVERMMKTKQRIENELYK